MSIKIDIHSREITRLLADDIIYTKFATVTVEQVTTQQQVETIVSNGYVETVADAQIGDYIVTNPDGERYILSPEKFASRYIATDVAGVYKATGSVKAIPNPFKTEIEITAPWGTPQFGQADCYIAVSVTDGIVNDKDRYLIEGIAFANTYRQ
jgi:hypothetical protein